MTAVTQQARVLVKPLSRSVASGSLATFSVEVEGAKDLTLQVEPCAEAEGYDVRLGDGAEAKPTSGPLMLAIQVPKDAGMA